MRQVSSRRAQSSGFIVFFLILGIGALLWGLLDAGAAEIFTTTLDQTSNQQAESVIKTRQRIWDGLLFFLIAFAGIFLVARSVVQSRLG